MANNADYVLLQFPDQMPAPILGELETIVNAAIANSPRLTQMLQAQIVQAVAQNLQSNPNIDPRIDARIDARIPQGAIAGQSPVWDGTRWSNGYATWLSRKQLIPFPSAPVNGWQFSTGFPSGYFRVGENIYWLQLACFKPQTMAFVNFENVITLPIATTSPFFGTSFENTISRINGALVQAMAQGLQTPLDGNRWILANNFIVTA